MAGIQGAAIRRSESLLNMEAASEGNINLLV
jgi:hypothetical protein